MNIKKSENIELEKIVGDKNQIDILFLILKKREHNISNVSTPTFDEHISFVRNHPYRFWYLIKFKGNYIGTVYIINNNCISISLLKYISIFPTIVQLIVNKHAPLKEIKSVRPPNFFINIAPTNKKIESQLIKIGAKKIQSSYSLAEIINYN
jgi:hypothetical protein